MLPAVGVMVAVTARSPRSTDWRSTAPRCGATRSPRWPTSPTGGSSSPTSRTSPRSACRRRSATCGRCRSRSSGTCSSRRRGRAARRRAAADGPAARRAGGRGRGLDGLDGDPLHAGPGPVSGVLRHRHTGPGPARGRPARGRDGAASRVHAALRPAHARRWAARGWGRSWCSSSRSSGERERAVPRGLRRGGRWRRWPRWPRWRCPAPRGPGARRPRVAPGRGRRPDVVRPLPVALADLRLHDARPRRARRARSWRRPGSP